MSFNYKNIIKSQSLRFFILRLFSFVPDKIMLKVQYWVKFGRRLNLQNPKRFTEHIQLYKINYRNPLLGVCVDKYEVRNYVKEKGLERILNTLFFVVNNEKEIKEDMLPEKFVLKSTDGSGGENIIICKSKEVFNLNEAKLRIKRWKNKKNINAGREWAYTQIQKTRFICEEYLEDSVNGLVDYKFFCFGGNPKYLQINIDRYSNHKELFYDIDGKRLDLCLSHQIYDGDFSLPSNFDEMIDIAKILSKDFPFVRVDLYNISGRIVFGELTFYPSSGYSVFHPDEYDFKFGKEFDLISNQYISVK